MAVAVTREELLSRIHSNLTRLLEIEEERLEILRHTRTIPEDLDGADAVRFSLADGDAALVTFEVPRGYVYLLKRYYATDVIDTFYYLYLDEVLYLTNVPDYEFQRELGEPLKARFELYVVNATGFTQTYLVSIRGLWRPRPLWERPITRFSP